MKPKDPTPPPAPKVKTTLNEFLECVPIEWRNAPVAIAVERDGFVDQGNYPIRRIILTIDSTGRRCVLFSKLHTNIV